jgi:hypothetical protein
MILAERNDVQLLWVSGHKGIEWNCWPAAKLGLAAPTYRTWTRRGVSELQGCSSGIGCAESTKNTGSLLQDRGTQRAFFLSSLGKGQLSTYFKGQSPNWIKLAVIFVGNVIRKQKQSHISCVCVCVRVCAQMVLAELRFRHLGKYFMELSNYDEISLQDTVLR